LLVTILISAMLLVTAVVATLVVATTEPFQQIMGLSLYGFCLTIFFFLLQAPDVVLAQLGVGTVALPFIVLLAMSKLRRRGGPKKKEKGTQA
jgi:energy-converting hydrogenase B subunit D